MAGIGYNTGITMAVVTALRQTFPQDGQYGKYKLNDVKIDIEYPMEKANWPYILVDYDETLLESSSIEDGIMSLEDSSQLLKAWRFEGDITFSLFSLSAYERDLMTDGIIAAIAFGDEFSKQLAENQYIHIELGDRKIRGGVSSKTPGTPWDTDEIVYYRELKLPIIGEFYSEASTLSVISSVKAYPRLEGEPDLPDNEQGEWV